MIALSYSRLSDYRQCPRKFKLKYLDKAKNFQIDNNNKGPHLVRGENIHKGLEKYLIRKKAGEENIAPSSLDEVESTKPLINKLMTIYDLHPEHQLAINANFEQVDWFSKDAWFRVIYDIIGFGPDLLVGDYKTGKLTDYMGSLEHPGQLHLSALVAMAIWPKYQSVYASYFYVDHKKPVDIRLNRAQHFDKLKETLQMEHAQVNAETEWAPCKNQFCNFCEATKQQCPDFSRKMDTTLGQ